MSKNSRVAILAFVAISLLSGACSSSASESFELLPVTVVPPVTYPPAIQPTPIPYPTATPLHIQDQRLQIPEVRAGEVDDNERWEEYLSFRSRYHGPTVHDVDVSERYIITALDTAE
jgi:hypothetical protein